VETSRQAIAAFNRGDSERLIEFLTPDCQWRPAMLAAVEGAEFQGHAGLNAYVEATADTWEEFRIVADEFRAVGEDRVLVLGRIQGRGRGSGVQVERLWAVVHSFRAGKITRVHAFLGHADALEAVGLEE
jgi:ketosteroid isomerase-like protein